MQSSKRLFFAMLLLASPLASGCQSCQKKEEPPPVVAEEDEDEKPKKKKKKDDDEVLPDVGAATAETTTGTTPKIGTGTVAKKDAGASDADKQKLIACCSALRQAAEAAGVAKAAAGDAALPGFVPPPKEELDKAVKECDKQVVNWNGDLNASLKNVKGATQLKLPSACFL
jgi:hypothetical protein